MSLRDWQKAVEERLRTGVPGQVAGFGQLGVWVQAVPDEDQLPRLPNLQVRPYLVLWYGQRMDGSADYNAITGELYSAKRSNFLVQVCAHQGELVLDAMDAVTRILRGFRPVGQGELRESASATIRRPMDISGVNSRVSVPVAFSGTVDL